MAISVIGQDPGSLAANHIKDIINAMTEAQKSQIDLKSKIMLSKIQQQQDLQTNKEKLAQGVQSNIDQKNANLNWMNSLSQDNNAYGSIGGVANSQTPNQMGDAMTMGQPTPAAPPGPSTPQMSMADQSQQPANNAASQMSMAPVAPATSPIGRPLPPPEGPVIMSPSGPVRNPNINSPDNISYNGIYNKWKSGQPLSAQESDLVRNKFSNGPDGKPLAQISNKEQETPGIVNPASNRVQTALRNYEKVTGAPEGSYWLNPSTGDAEVSPIWKSKMEAQARYNVEAPDRYGKMAEQDLMHVFSMRSGALGVQDAKINQAMHIKQLFDQSYDPKTGVYNLKAPQFAEATQGLAVLVSNSNQTSEGQRQEIKQRTAKGDFDGALTYFLGTPKNATTQDIAKMYIDAVDRQGVTAQFIKDKDISDVKNLDSFRQLKKFDPERADNLYKASFGVDYKEYMNKPWNERVKMVTGTDPTQSSSQGGSQGGGSNTVTMQAPNGKQYTFSADQAEEARKNGWK